VRALEVIELTGAPFGAGLPGEADLWRPTVVIGLRAERAALVQRLDRRVEGMWRDGLLDEVARLRPGGLGTTASRAIGYAQALAQLDGALTEQEAIEQTAALTRRYARRQVSWFGRSTGTVWLDVDDPDRVGSALALVRSAPPASLSP
jgi:tRNA dimethylallyltransferase